MFAVTIQAFLIHMLFVTHEIIICLSGGTMQGMMLILSLQELHLNTGVFHMNINALSLFPKHIWLKKTARKNVK